MKNKLMILALPLILLLSISTQVRATGPEVNENELPTREEVLKTGHPLTIHLYGSLIKYNKKPMVPDTSNLGECLRQHTLLASPWIEEKRFIENIENAYKANVSENNIKKTITDNKNYKDVPEITQKLLMNNLMQAFKDCTKKASK